MRADTVSATDTSSFDVIRYSLSAIRTDDTDIVLATRTYVTDSYPYAYAYPFECETSLLPILD